MRKSLFLTVVVFIVSGCASFWNSWVATAEGTDFDQYVARYGVPTSQYQMQTGEMAYSFRKQCSYVHGYEETLVVVYPNNIIKSISRTQYCPSEPPPPKKQK